MLNYWRRNTHRSTYLLIPPPYRSVNKFLQLVMVCCRTQEFSFLGDCCRRLDLRCVRHRATPAISPGGASAHGAVVSPRIDEQLPACSIRELSPMKNRISMELRNNLFLYFGKSGLKPAFPFPSLGPNPAGSMNLSAESDTRRIPAPLSLYHLIYI